MFGAIFYVIFAEDEIQSWAKPFMVDYVKDDAMLKDAKVGQPNDVTPEAPLINDNSAPTASIHGKAEQPSSNIL